MIETERLVLRKPRLDDVPRLAFLRDPEVMHFIGGVVPLPVEEVVRIWLARWEANGFGYLLLERRDDGALVGRSGITLWDTRAAWEPSTVTEAGEYGQPELGWALVREHWGKGYATEAAVAARAWAFGELGIGRLVSVVAPANEASARVARRLGAVPGETIELFDMGEAVVWEHPR